MRQLRRLFFGALAVTFYRRLIVYETRLDRPQVGPDPGFPVELGVVSEEELEDYCRLRPDTSRDEVRRRLERGDRCFAVRRGGELLSVRWLSASRADLPYLGLSFALGPDLVFAYDAYTDPGARGARLGTLGGAYMSEQARREGSRALLSTALPENEGGRTLLARRGSRPVGTIHCLRLGPVRVPIRRLPEGYLGPVSRR